MIRVLAGLCLLFATGASLAGEKLRLDVGRDVYTLSGFDDRPDGYFGRFAFRYEMTGGTLLHLFPNHRFVISDWFDIGPDRTLATGTFAVSDTQLTLNFARFRPGSESIASRFSDLRIAWGWIEKPGYVTGYEVFVFPPTEWKRLKETSSISRYKQRDREYNDWEKILEKFSSRIETKQP